MPVTGVAASYLDFSRSILRSIMKISNTLWGILALLHADAVVATFSHDATVTILALAVRFGHSSSCSAGSVLTGTQQGDIKYLIKKKGSGYTADGRFGCPDANCEYQCTPAECPGSLHRVHTAQFSPDGSFLLLASTWR